MRILILMNHAGGGHASVANALSEQLKQLGHHCEVVNADLFSTANITRLVTSTYGPIIQYTPSTFKQVFKATNTKARTRLVNKTNSLLIRQKLLSYIRKTRPDIIVSVQPLYVGSVVLLRKYFADIPFGVVVTDLVTIHPLWLDNKVDFTVVPTDEAEDLAIQAGLSPAMVERVGLPIRAGFNPEKWEKNQARQDLGLPEEEKIVFVGGNGEGAGSIYRITELLLRLTPYHIVAVAGRNNLLYQRLKPLMDQYTQLTVYKFVDFMPKLMAASDAIVTKPGPTIMTEAMTMGLPMVVLPTPMYQEQGNIELVHRYQLGKVVANINEVVPALEQILTQPYEGRPYQGKDVSRQVANAIVLHTRK